MKAKLKVIKNWEFEEFELTGTSFKYSPTGCKGMVARSEDEIVFWTYHLVQKCSGVLWVKGEVSRWIPSPEPKEQQDVWEDPVLLSCDRGILLVCPASKSLWWMPQMDGEWIPIPMDNWCAQGIPKPVAVTGSQGVFPIVCRVDNSADATNSFTSLTVDFETMTAHWAESGSCVYSKAGTRQTHLAAVERAGGNFAQADFHYNYPMIGSILEQNGQFYAFLESSTINPAGLSLMGYTLVGFHVKGYPVTDELLAPFAGHKSMVNFGVENGALTDACFPFFSAMPKLRYLLLTGNAGIDGSGLSALQSCKLDLLALDHTRLEDAGLLRAASIPKLSHIWIDHTAVTYDGLLAVAGNNYIHPVAHVQFTKEQMEHFSQLQREKAKKPVQLDEQAASECRNVLSAFFAEMTEWEQYMEQVGFEDAEAVPRLLAIWEKYVSEKPRLGYRPLALSYSAQGTYNGEEFLDAEQITKNKLYIYTREKNTSFDRRFLMKRVGEGWMIDAVQERLDGWQRTGL